MNKITLFAAVTVVAATLAGCAAVQQRPVLYPNAKLKQVGDAGAQRDVDECVVQAEKAGAASGGSAAGRGAVQGAAVGGAAAAVGSLIRGRGLLESAAAGAAVGGTAGAVGGAFHDGEGSPVFRNFVGRCLAERGYDVIGWK